MPLGDMSNILLQKVEELTLYAIEQQKKLEDQNKTIENQSKMLEVMAARLNNLEKNNMKTKKVFLALTVFITSLSFGQVNTDTTTGNVVIGTLPLTSGNKLEVLGDTKVNGAGNFESNVIEGGAIALTNSLKTESNDVKQWKIFNMTGAYGNGLNFWAYSNNSSKSGSKMTLYDNGNVGIGIAIPSSKLDVYIDLSTVGKYDSQKWSTSSLDYNLKLQTIWNTEGINQAFVQRYNGVDYNSLSFYLGKVGIGTTRPNEMLTVKGKIHAEEIIVDLNVPADYVFQKYYTGKSELKSDYVMPTLAEIENFTKKNNHLPSVPSAQEVQQNGLSLGDMSNILLQKVEELTLYAIEQQKELERLKTENKNYKSLAERLSAIEKELKK